MQQDATITTIAPRISKAVTLAVLDQRHARRGAAASAEAAFGLLMLHEGRLKALRRRQELIARRREIAARRIRIDGVRQAYAAANAA